MPDQNQLNDEEEVRQRVNKEHKRELELCAQDFWYFMRFIETEDEDQAIFRPFPRHYPYLREFNKTIEDNQKTILLKSRRLLASWIMVMRQYWQAKFANTGIKGSKDVFRGGLMSIGKTEAEYLVQRISRSDKRLPLWLQQKNPMSVDNKMYLEFERGGTIQAFPLKREGPQTFGFTEVGFDEMSRQEAVRSCWTGLIPTLGDRGKLVAVSTPKGKRNLFADIWFNKNQAYTDIARVTMHWTDNPEHDQAWFDKTTTAMDPQMIACMFELSFAAYYGDSVWSKWNTQMHKVEDTALLDSPMYIGWDLGYNNPAAVFFQRNTKDQWIGHREVMGDQISFDLFCRQVIEMANTFYDREKVAEIHCCPPDARHRYQNRAMSGAVSSAGEIKQSFGFGNQPARIIFCPGQTGTREVEAPRLSETRKTFAMRKDNEPGAYFNKRMEIFIEGCQGGYCYPESGDSEVPEKNEYSHIQDAYQHIVAAHTRMYARPAKQQASNAPQSIRRKPKYRVGLPARNR